MRLLAWYVVCAGLILGHVVWFTAMRLSPEPARPAVILTGGATLATLILLLALLLATTPPDAIRLPRGRSERLIIAGAIVLQLVAVCVASPLPVSRVASTSVGVIAFTVLMLWLLRGRGNSAWIAALVGWNPLVTYEMGVMGRMTAGIAVLLLPMLLLATVRRRD